MEINLSSESESSPSVDGTGYVLMKPHVPDIPGLHYFRAFLDDQQQGSAIRQIDESAWLTDLERRVQHYGWRYDYRARTIDRGMRIGPLPDWLAEIAALLHEHTGKFDSVPNQAIVNEYEPGQGIAMHVDRRCFGRTVATVSLGDDWMMDFRAAGGNEKAQGSVLPLGTDIVHQLLPARLYMHGIDPIEAMHTVGNLQALMQCWKFEFTTTIRIGLRTTMPGLYLLRLHVLG